MKFGQQLPYEVADELDRLGIRSEVVPVNSPDGRHARVDLRVFPSDPGQLPYEFQITLRRFVEGKIAYFMKSALERLRRGPCVYLEILDWGRTPMLTLARRVADAIRTVVHRIRSFEDGLMLGVRLVFKRSGTQLQTFSLFGFAGPRLRSILERESRNLDGLLATFQRHGSNREEIEERVVPNLVAELDRVIAEPSSPAAPKPRPLPFWHSAVRHTWRPFVDTMAIKRRFGSFPHEHNLPLRIPGRRAA